MVLTLSLARDLQYEHEEGNFIHTPLLSRILCPRATFLPSSDRLWEGALLDDTKHCCVGDCFPGGRILLHCKLVSMPVLFRETINVHATIYDFLIRWQQKLLFCWTIIDNHPTETSPTNSNVLTENKEGWQTQGIRFTSTERLVIVMGVPTRQAAPTPFLPIKDTWIPKWLHR